MKDVKEGNLAWRCEINRAIFKASFILYNANV